MTPEQFPKDYEAATESQDLERTLGLIDEKAVYWFSDGGRHVGHEAIKAVLTRNFAAIEDEKYAISEVQVLAQSKEVASCVNR